MKKLFIATIIFVLCAFSVVFAEKPEGADEISFMATVHVGSGETEDAEIWYYIPSGGNDVRGGKLTNGDPIEIYYEEERPDGSVMFYFITPNETAEAKWQSVKKIKKDNFTVNATDLSAKKYNIAKNPTTILTMSQAGTKVYKFPALCFEEIQSLIPATKLDVYHLDYYRDSNWYYAKEIDGYIHIVNNVAGIAGDVELITPTNVKLYKTPDFNEVILEIEPGVAFGEYVKLSDNCYYVSAYGEKDGYIKASDMAVKSNGEKSTIWYENIRLYREGNFRSKILVYDVPVNSEITWEYNMDMSKYGWVRTTYKNQTGWFFLINANYVKDDSDEASAIREEYFEAVRLGEQVAASYASGDVSGDVSGEETPVYTPTVRSDSGESEYSGEVGGLVDPFDVPPEPEVKEPKKEIPLQTKVIICCCATIVVLILIIVILSKKNAWYRNRYRRGKW